MRIENFAEMRFMGRDREDVSYISPRPWNEAAPFPPPPGVGGSFLVIHDHRREGVPAAAQAH